MRSKKLRNQSNKALAKMCINITVAMAVISIFLKTFIPILLTIIVIILSLMIIELFRFKNRRNKDE